MNEIRQQVQERLDIHRRNLADLQEQQAKLGIQAGPAIQRQIEDEQKQIDILAEMLAKMESGPVLGAIFDAQGQMANHDRQRIDERISALRTDLMQWQAQISNELMDMAETKLNPLDRQIGELTTAVQRMSDLQSQMHRDLQKALSELDRTVALNSHRIATLERRTEDRGNPLLPPPVMAGGFIFFAVLLSLLVFIAWRLV